MATPNLESMLTLIRIVPSITLNRQFKRKYYAEIKQYTEEEYHRYDKYWRDLEKQWKKIAKKY